MNFEEFLKPDETEATTTPTENEVVENAVDPAEAVEAFAVENGSVEDAVESLDVQKAVVESLAADKAVQDETIAALRRDNYALQTTIAKLNAQVAEQAASLAKVGDLLAANVETTLSSKISLIDRDTELPDRFEGETRDHVLEALKEARNAAEKEGRIRHAQILESVLCANEPNGTLARRRGELEKLFDDNANIVSGPVIARLTELGIPHKNGEEYLLPSEIIKRTF